MLSIRSMTRSRVWLCFVIRCVAGAIAGGILSAWPKVVNTTPLSFGRTGTTLGAHMAVADIDLRTTQELVELINDADATVAAAVRRASPDLAGAIDAIVERLERGGRLVYVGAGSSGRLALVDAAECGPTFGVPPELVIALVAGGPSALATAQEAAEDDDGAGVVDVEA